LGYFVSAIIGSPQKTIPNPIQFTKPIIQVNTAIFGTGALVDIFGKGEALVNA